MPGEPDGCGFGVEVGDDDVAGVADALGCAVAVALGDDAGVEVGVEVGTGVTGEMVACVCTVAACASTGLGGVVGLGVEVAPAATSAAVGDGVEVGVGRGVAEATEKDAS